MELTQEIADSIEQAITGDCGKFHADRPLILSRTHQFKNGDFRACAEADGETGSADAAIDIELAA